MMRSMRPVWPLLLLSACAGDGSEVGPVLPKLPGASSKVVVLDDQGRGVTGARATVGSAVALSGPNGRGELFASPRGRVLVDVDGTNGAAVVGDGLGRVRFATTVVGPDLPSVVFLPDLGSAPTTLNVGVQGATVTATSANGAILRVPAGASVGAPDAATTVALRVGDLQAAHVPGDLPRPAGGGAFLTGRVVCVDPPGATFAPAVDVDVADDVSLAGATGVLLHLSADTGEWTEVATGLSASGGRVAANGAVARGGLYVLACEVPVCSVRGRVLDAATPTPAPVPDAMILVDGRVGRTGRDGVFLVDGLPATTGIGGTRSAEIEVFSGGDWLPVRTTATVPVMANAEANVGDLVLDTVPAGNVRVQQIRRGRGESLRPVRISAQFTESAFATFSDVDGQATFEDVPAQWFGFVEARAVDAREVIFGQQLQFLDNGRRWIDTAQFFEQRPWFLGTRRVRAIVTDSVGGGPIRGAGVVGGVVSNTGFVGLTDQSGTFFVDRDFDGRATASLRTSRDGATIVSATTIEHPDAEHLELAIRRQLRPTVGAFDRHGLVQGTLLGADGSRQHRLRATRRIDLQEWWDDVVDGVPIRSSLPIDVDPASTHGAFVAGVDRTGGHLAAAELTVAGAVATLRSIGIAADVEPVEGDVISRDITLDHPATTAFIVPQGLAGLQAPIVAADLRLSLALEQPSGRAIDVVRDIGGNHAASGSDLVLQLPALTGQFAGHRWRVLVSGSGAAAGGGTVTQRSLSSLRGVGTESAAPLLVPPQITAPAAGGTVAANGFTVQFSLPGDVLYATLELRSVVGTETMLWQVLLPPDVTEFSFLQLPAEMVTPLVAGRTYSLTLTAFRASTGPLSGRPFSYRDLSAFYQSIGAVERGVDSASSHTITISSS